jgi:hypothetical protein
MTNDPLLEGVRARKLSHELMIMEAEIHSNADTLVESRIVALPVLPRKKGAPKGPVHKLVGGRLHQSTTELGVFRLSRSFRPVRSFIPTRSCVR